MTKRSNDKKALTTYLPKELKDRYVKDCKKHYISPSAHIRLLIANYLENKK